MKNELILNDRVCFNHIVCGRVHSAEGRIVRVLNPGEVPGEVIRRDFPNYRVANNDWRAVREIRFLVLVDENILHLPRSHMIENVK